MKRLIIINKQNVYDGVNTDWHLPVRFTNENTKEKCEYEYKSFQ